MVKFTSLFLSMILFISLLGYGQGNVRDDGGEVVISGKVLSTTDNSPLPGVAVAVKGTSIGGITDINGDYSISVPASAEILVFTFMGHETSEVEINGRTVINESLNEETDVLTEVIITAQGISKEKRALGYAVSTVESKDLEQKTQGDIGRVLFGKLPGVRVNQSNGLSGSGTNIIIRGYTSINQTNQPLFIVDGVPFNSDSNQQQGFQDGRTESSRFLDLDPNMIESVSVLKGLSAATLYGSRGRNGVILITTKNNVSRSGPNKTSVSVTQSFFQNEISSLPNYQKSYGGGWNQYPAFYYSNWGANFNENLRL